jgi:P4 family phage/plasmid primase-like protien
MKRAASNAATSELARAKGKRFASLQEPSEGEQINCGFMKELSGGDKIMARSLFKEPIEFVPQFKMALLCNHLPLVPSDDGGTWRRIRVVEFTSRFVDNPVEENEFPIDTELSEKLETWKEYFMSMLLEYYKLYKSEGITEPVEVLQCTREYKRQNDHLADYIFQNVEKKDGGFLTINEAFQDLRVWIRDDQIPIAKVPTKSDFEKYLAKHFACKCVSVNNNKGFRGYALKTKGTFEGVE